MKKVYVVTDGMYSDFHVVAMFSTQKKADAFTKLLNYDEAYEWELDPPVAEKAAVGLDCWRVVMLRDGTVKKAKKQTGSDRHHRAWHRIDLKDYWNPDRPPLLIVLCFARDKEHAIKIAGDIRPRSIVDGEWDESEPEPPKPIGITKDIKRLPGGGISITVELEGGAKE